MDIPEDIHQHVLGIARAIAEASSAGDTRAQWQLHGQLREFCHAMADAGRDHPFLWETLADFTRDDRVAIGLYQRALLQVRQLGSAEAEASICMELAQRHLVLAEPAIAYAFALRADDAARLTDDLPLRQRVSQFLLDHSLDDPQG
ncbi:hypothetical protein [Stenotrophomonas rhizophila]|uniref:hypothetical protein n=1 Tax=Stenotrophomonas rhizophila TaxID=216778 RepID=UPI001E29A95D|nr:hypothetical protein [Stenotrophomonas rhizophila]MCC7635541.1 hypothetical protein [Stenotrophomonas rhizophila]MCC7664693.1 hypothetical protein [Stenotrophomonas rhizophila]